MNNTLFAVTFTNMFSAEHVKQFSDNFFGMCAKTEATEDPKVLHLWPSKNEYRLLRVQLVQLEEQGGVLTFVETPPADASICSSMKNVLFVVEVLAAEDAWQFCEDQFVGLCAIREPSSNPPLINLWPTEDEEGALRAKLVELEKDGALTFVDGRRVAREKAALQKKMAAEAAGGEDE